jgi:hypothetical protein
MRDYRRCTSIAKAMNADAPKLTELVRTLGEGKVESYMKLWLVDLNNTLDLKKPLNETQIDKIAFNVVDRYRSLNIADINLIFSNVSNGEYQEDIKDRITVSTVMSWFRKYFKERIDMAGELSYQNHVQKKSAFGGVQHETTRTREAHKAAHVWHQKNNERQAAQQRVDAASKKANSNNNPK